MKDQRPASFKTSEELPLIDDYWDLFQTTGWNDEYSFTKADLGIAIAHSWYRLSIYDSGTLVGFGRIISDGVHHALIVDIIVRPQYQNKGIGSFILDGLIEKCKSNRIRDIQLFAAADKHGFYEKHGFVSRPHNAPGMQYLYAREPDPAPPHSSFTGNV